MAMKQAKTRQAVLDPVDMNSFLIVTKMKELNNINKHFGERMVWGRG